MPLAAFIAVTKHVPGRLAVRTLRATEQPRPWTEKLTPPLPDPPALVSLIGVPATPARAGLLTSSRAWSAARKMNVTGAETDATRSPLAARVAVTRQVAGARAMSERRSMSQFLPATTKLTSSALKPPLLVSMTGVPATADRLTFEIAIAD